MSEEKSKVAQIIEEAIADGVLSRAESERIKAAIKEDNLVTKEEIELWNQLQRQIAEGEITIN